MLWFIATPLVSASIPNARRQAVTAAPAPKPWISIGKDGAARTITPTVTTIDKAVQTISGPPSSLTTDATWILSLNGMATTTVLAPHPAPTSDFGSKKGAWRVAVTWDPSAFSHQDDKLHFEVVYDDSRAESILDNVNASVGYYAWKLPADILTKHNSTAMNASIKYNFQSHDSSEFNEIRGNGPRVVITEDVMWPVHNTGNVPRGPLSYLIAIPIVCVLLILLGCYCCWSYRKRGIIPGAAAVASLKPRSARGRTSQGYGVRKSRAQRTGTVNPPQDAELPRVVAGRDSFRANHQPEDKTLGSGIQLTSSDSWSPTSPSGRNVFREEIQRQESRR